MSIGKSRCMWLVCVVLVCCALTAASGQVSGNSSVILDKHYGDLPLAFEPNVGQAAATVKYVAHAANFTALFEDRRIRFRLPGKSSGRSRSNAALSFPGSSRKSRILAGKLQPGRTNYLVGNDPSKWRTGVVNHADIRYAQLYPGIDLIFYGNHRRLEHDFVVAPGADYRRIRLRLDGAKSFRLAANGDLLASTADGTLTLRKPSIYQWTGSRKTTIEGAYVLGARQTVALRLSAFDHSKALIIDPVLVYSTYIAGSSAEQAVATAVDAAGDAYLTGYTFSVDFPTEFPLQRSCNCTNGPDVFVLKLNPSGTGLIFSTFLGGSSYDVPNSIAVDRFENAIVAGYTQSSDFPLFAPIQATISGQFPQSGFVSSLNSTGSGFNFSTYLGGSSSPSAASAVGADANGNVYVAGMATSVNLPVTSRIGFTSQPNGDFYVAKITTAGTLVFVTAIGTTSLSINTANAQPKSIAVDSIGDTYIVGGAALGFPTTAAAFQPACKASPTGGTCANAFIAKLNFEGTAFEYATYLGGSSMDTAFAVAIDTSGNAYVTGTTYSNNFPVTPGAYKTRPSGCCGFVSKLDPTGSKLVYSTLLSGSGYGSFYPSAVAVDGSGHALISGSNSDPSYPLVHPLESTLPSTNFFQSNAAVISELNASGSTLLFSTFLSGSGGSLGTGIASLGNRYVYVTGTSFDTDFPVTPNAFQTSVVPPPPFVQPQHAYISRIDLNTPAPAVCLPSAQLGFGFVAVGIPSQPQFVSLSNCGNATLTIGSVATSDPSFSALNICVQNIYTWQWPQQPPAPGPLSVAVGALCNIPVRFTPPNTNLTTGVLSISDNAPITPQKLQLSGQGALPVLFIQMGFMTLDDQLVGHHSLPQWNYISNNGYVPLNISSMSISGDFALNNKCPAQLQPGQFCTFSVTFTPTAPGLRTGAVTIVDNAAGSPQTIPLSGTGYTAYPVPTIYSIAPGFVQVGSGNLTLTVGGNYFFSVSRILVNGVAQSTKFLNERSLQATIPGSSIAQLGPVSISVSTPQPGGGVSNALPLTAYLDLPLSATGLAYDPFGRVLYASISSSASANANAIVPIDPTTGIASAAIPAGGGPNQLAISDDGHYLYIGLDNDQAIHQYDLVAGKFVSTAALPAGTKVYDMQVAPTQPNIVAASLFFPFTSPPEAGVALYSNGIQLSYLPSAAVDSIRFLASPSNLYGSVQTYTSLLDTFAINNSALTLIQSVNVPASFAGMGSDSHFLYTTSGLVFDPVAMAAVGTYQLPSSVGVIDSVVPDDSVGRTFFLDEFGGLYAFDQQTFMEAGGPSLLPNNSSFNLVRWGQDGFACLAFNYSTSSSDVIIFRSLLANPSTSTNPVPALTSLSPSTVAVGMGNFVLTVNGSKFVPGAVARWNGADRTTVYVSATQLTADIAAADVSAASTATVTVSNPSPGGGVSSGLTLSIH